MDIVYVVKEDLKNDSEALRYSLRSLKNLPHDKVVIAGEKPSWVRNVLYLPVPQAKAKHENWRANLLAAAQHPDVSEDFVLMNDDFFIMKPIPEIPNYNFGSLKNVLQHYRDRYEETSTYMQHMECMYHKLLNMGFKDPISYELHTPMTMNKQKVMALSDHMAWPDCSQFRSLYGNIHHVGGKTVKDVKVFLDPTHNDAEYSFDSSRYLDKQTFLSATGMAYGRGLVGEHVRRTFADKCEYEA